jgi:hypothetical protein
MARWLTQLSTLHQQRVDATRGDRQERVDAVDLQGQPAMRDEPAHRRKLGPVEMGASPPQLGPGFALDLVGIGVGTDQNLAMEAGVGAKGEARARHGRNGSLEQSRNKLRLRGRVGPWRIDACAAAIFSTPARAGSCVTVTFDVSALLFADVR